MFISSEWNINIVHIYAATSFYVENEMLINEAVALSKKKDSIAKSFEFNKQTLVKILSKQNKTKANGEKTGGVL